MRPSWGVYAGAVPPCLLIQTNAPTSPGAMNCSSGTFLRPRRAARSASISRLLTAVSGLTVRFYWDCICSAKIPSPQRLEWESAGAVCSSELLAGDGRVVANIYSLGCFWGPVQAGSPPVLRELCASRACRPRIVLCPFPNAPSATPYIVATAFIAHNICLFLWVLDA